jgi:hypothetical protein
MSRLATSRASEVFAMGSVPEPSIGRGDASHWRMNDFRQSRTTDAYYNDDGPAYHYGVGAFGKSLRLSFEHAQADLSRDWNVVRGDSPRSCCRWRLKCA